MMQQLLAICEQVAKPVTVAVVAAGSVLMAIKLECR
jgi:hypothetical protein